MPTPQRPGRSLVSRRAVLDVVRAAAIGSYGVTGFAANPLERLAGAAGLAEPGIHLRLRDDLAIRLDLTVAFGLPVAEVARQVDSAVRYAVRRTFGREVDRLAINVRGLTVLDGAVPERPSRAATGTSSIELAESGTDVA